MYSASLQIDDDIIDAIENNAGKLPALMETAFKRQARRIKSQLLTALRTEPGPVKYPIQWASERQRRAFFASNGFGRGIPTRRTGALVNAWEVNFVSVGNTYELIAENSKPYARYVIGAQQQPFHRNTGWYKADNILTDATIKAQEALIDTWFTVTDEFAGI